LTTTTGTCSTCTRSTTPLRRDDIRTSTFASSIHTPAPFTSLFESPFANGDIGGSGRSLLELEEFDEDGRFISSSFPGTKFPASQGSNGGKGRKKLVFTEEAEQATKGAEDNPSDATLSSYSHQIAHTFYKSARSFNADQMTLANNIMYDMTSEKSRKENSAMRSIIAEYNAKHGHSEPKFENTLSSVKYRGAIEHPNDMRARFDSERRRVHTVLASEVNTGRHLMDSDWEKTKNEYLSQRRIDEAKALAEQERSYREHEITRMKFVNVAYNSVSNTMKTNLEELVSPADLMNHWDETLRHFGYRDLKHIRDDFVEIYGDGAGFATSLSWIGELPFFQYFETKANPLPDNLRLLDWEEEQRALQEARAFALNTTKSTGRSLLEVIQQNQDVDVAGNKQSKESFGAMPMISTRNCFSKPKNKMCIPQIPADFAPTLGIIRFTEAQEDSIRAYIIFCTPWETLGLGLGLGNVHSQPYPKPNHHAALPLITSDFFQASNQRVSRKSRQIPDGQSQSEQTLETNHKVSRKK